METVLIDYCLRFNKYDVFENVSFGARLTRPEIDSLAFLFSVYFDQKTNVYVKGLTFSTEFNRCVAEIRRNFETKNDNTLNDVNVKRLFSFFLQDEFMQQVPEFQLVIKYLKQYYKPVQSPNVAEIASMCAEECSAKQLQCFQCKCRYLSSAVTVFDSGIQDGWDVFLRPMFGMPLLLYILLRTDFDKNGVFNENDLITNSFTMFLYNLLCDKASSNYVDHKACRQLVSECRRVTVGMTDRELEMLLCSLNTSSYHTKLFAPFKMFMQQIGKMTKIKKANKIASVVFTGFFLRHYLDAAPNKTMSAAELEIRNVCRLLLKKYTNERFEEFIVKLKNMKTELALAIMENLLVPESFIRRLCIKYNLDDDILLLLNSAPPSSS